MVKATFSFTFSLFSFWLQSEQMIAKWCHRWHWCWLRLHVSAMKARDPWPCSFNSVEGTMSLMCDILLKLLVSFITHIICYTYYSFHFFFSFCNLPFRVLYVSYIFFIFLHSLRIVANTGVVVLNVHSDVCRYRWLFKKLFR